MRAALQPLFLSVPEAAAVLGVGRTFLYQLVAAKRLALVKLGRKSLVPVESLEALARTISEPREADGPTEGAPVGRNGKRAGSDRADG